MKYLLDTHTYLWWLDEHSRLSEDVLRAVSDQQNAIYVSTVTFWELAIKSSLNKLRLRLPLSQMAADLAPKDGFELLNLRLSHCLAVEELPYHHGDPFDRVLISQAKAENLTLLSKDLQFDAYGVSRVW